jgi:hypothetical protein
MKQVKTLLINPSDMSVKVTKWLSSANTFVKKLQNLSMSRIFFFLPIAIDIIRNKVLGHTTVRPERVEGYTQDMLRHTQHVRKKEFLISDNVYYTEIFFYNKENDVDIFYTIQIRDNRRLSKGLRRICALNKA